MDKGIAPGGLAFGYPAGSPGTGGGNHARDLVAEAASPFSPSMTASETRCRSTPHDISYVPIIKTAVFLFEDVQIYP